ncbi:MAG: hypothetical protein PHC70_02830 [Patescibacteria group bacterium]|nr:hypothetical protein [Patescibacteria group bacterium]
MCGGHVSQQRLTATGLLNSLKKSEWIGVAEELALLSPKDYEKVIHAFALYREALILESSAGYQLPKRPVKRK